MYEDRLSRLERAHISYFEPEPSVRHSSDSEECLTGVDTQHRPEEVITNIANQDGEEDTRQTSEQGGQGEAASPKRIPRLGSPFQFKDTHQTSEKHQQLEDPSPKMRVAKLGSPSKSDTHHTSGMDEQGEDSSPKKLFAKLGSPFKLKPLRNAVRASTSAVRSFGASVKASVKASLKGQPRATPTTVNPYDPASWSYYFPSPRSSAPSWQKNLPPPDWVIPPFGNSPTITFIYRNPNPGPPRSPSRGAFDTLDRFPSNESPYMRPSCFPRMHSGKCLSQKVFEGPDDSPARVGPYESSAFASSFASSDDIICSAPVESPFERPGCYPRGPQVEDFSPVPPNAPRLAFTTLYREPGLTTDGKPKTPE
ncbi:uncharacterized protein N7529_001936 [Penicillium soppii]|uniref:uncharacterized protein n=1 Tax=Penicillium soppii TaxID=69789 RepID=UPI0025472FED|nr:uncharacterized protein N7529_001936 [Penicillium soppii]KAJ5876352.1 hypothetical protein N7529_001936 [Penicillium soppii]